MENITLNKALKWIFVFVVFSVLVGVLNLLSDVLIPFAIAFLLAYLINPFVCFVEKKIKSRGFAVFAVLCFLCVVGFACFYFIVPMILSEIGRLLTLIDSIISNSDLHKQVSNYIPQDFLLNIKEYMAQKDISYDLLLSGNAWKVSVSVLRKLVPGVWDILSGAATFVFGLLGLTVVVLYLIFLLLDYKKVSENWLKLIPHSYRDNTEDFVNEFNMGMKRYFRAQCLIAFIVGVILAIGFKIVGLPLAILLGLFIGCLNIVPYLQIAGFIPAFILSLLHAVSTGQNVWGVFGIVVLVVAVAQLIQDALLVPKIMGKVTGLSPVVILLSLSVWGKLLGFFGLLIAIPATCLVLAYYQKFLINIHED